MKVSVVTGTLLWCWAHGTPRKKGQCLVNRLVPFQFAMQIFGRTRAGNLAISLSDILERSSNWLIYPSRNPCMHACAFFSLYRNKTKSQRERRWKSHSNSRGTNLEVKHVIQLPTSMSHKQKLHAKQANANFQKTHTHKTLNQNENSKRVGQGTASLVC
jgi:hypothetical protein